MRQTRLMAVAGGLATIAAAMSISHHIVHGKVASRPIRPIATLNVVAKLKQLGLPQFRRLLSAAGT